MGQGVSKETLRQDVAAQIAVVPFKGLEIFYDISPLLLRPRVFNMCIDLMRQRCRGLDIDYVAGVDARGFVLGTPLALALHAGFLMVHKAGKLPNAVESKPYGKEYAEAHGTDKLCITRGAIGHGSRVLVVDDVVATGATLKAAVDLLREQGAHVVGCMVVAEVEELKKDRMAINVPVLTLIPHRLLHHFG